MYKKIMLLALILVCFTFASCNQANKNGDISINSTNKQQIVDKLEDDNQSDTTDNKGNEGQENNSYIDLTLYREVERNIEYEIIDISEEEYQINSFGKTFSVYIAYIKINHFFDQDLANKINYELNLNWESFIESTYMKNQLYEELCLNEHYKENKEYYKKDIRNLLSKMAIKKEDLNYFSINEKYIGYIECFGKVLVSDAKENNQYMQVIDMTNTGYSLKIKDNQLILDGLTAEQIKKIKDEKSFLRMNKYLPEKYQLKMNISVNDYINWLVDVYNYREDIRQKYGSCIRS